jgi:hypothetical protein
MMGTGAFSRDNMVGCGVDHPPHQKLRLGLRQTTVYLFSLCLHGLLVREHYTLPSNSVAVSTVHLYICVEYSAVTHHVMLYG